MSLILLILASVAACSPGPDADKTAQVAAQPSPSVAPTLTPEAERQVLLSRASEFWAARVAGDLTKAYAYEQIGKEASMPLSAYVRRAGLIYRSAQVEEVVIDGDQATVRVKLNMVVPGMPDPIDHILQDRWVRLDKQWFHGKS